MSCKSFESKACFGKYFLCPKPQYTAAQVVLLINIVINYFAMCFFGRFAFATQLNYANYFC